MQGALRAPCSSLACSVTLAAFCISCPGGCSWPRDLLRISRAKPSSNWPCAGWHPRRTTSGRCTTKYQAAPPRRRFLKVRCGRSCGLSWDRHPHRSVCWASLKRPSPKKTGWRCKGVLVGYAKLGASAPVEVSGADAQPRHAHRRRLRSCRPHPDHRNARTGRTAGPPGGTYLARLSSDDARVHLLGEQLVKFLRQPAPPHQHAADHAGQFQLPPLFSLPKTRRPCAPCCWNCCTWCLATLPH